MKIVSLCVAVRPLAVSLGLCLAFAGFIGFPKRKAFAATPPPPFVVMPSTPEGEILAALKFDPAVNGFSFENYGNEDHDWRRDLTAADLIKMFGAENVCHSGSTPKDCKLTAAAREWLDAELKAMDGGHCEGMAVVSLRFLTGRPFNGRKLPADYQKGAETPHEIERGRLHNLIAHFHVLQSLEEVSEYEANSDRRPSAIVANLIQSFKKQADPGTLGFFQVKRGEFINGHAVTPFAVEAVGEDQYRIHIYDNNYPNETKYMDVDAKRERWRYRTSTKPGESVNDYFGDTKTKNLSLTPLSARVPKTGRHFNCPFAVDEVSNDEGEEGFLSGIGTQFAGGTVKRLKASRAVFASGTKPTLDGEDVVFFMSGPGSYNVTDGQGRMVGYDPEKEEVRNEIPDADIINFLGGLNRNIPPTIVMSYDGATKKPYVVNISGRDLNRESNADFVYAGPGFTVGFDNLKLDPNESETVRIRPDGRELTCTAASDGEIPVVSFAFDPTKHGVSYIVNLTAVDLQPGATLTVSLDPEKGTLTFKESKTKEGVFLVELIRIDADGDEDVYEAEADLGAGATYLMDFSHWDGASDIPFYVDDEGNGFGEDDRPKSVQNHKNHGRKTP
jgi:hypothetical protein